MSFVEIVSPVTFLGIIVVGIIWWYTIKQSSGQRPSPAVIALGLVMLFLVNYWHHQQMGLWSDTQQPVKQGQSLRIPLEEQVLVQPLMLDVDLCGADGAIRSQEVAIDTAQMHILFDSRGGMITQIEYVHPLEGKQGLISGLKTRDIARDSYKYGAFLLAFERNTPLAYTHIGTTHDAEHGRYTVTFKATTEDAEIEKCFTIFDTQYRIDLALSITPKHGAIIKPRLFLSGPFVHDLVGDEAVRAIVYTDRGRLEKFNGSSVEGRLWVMPTLFGVEDRYYVHAITDDVDGFIARAYYRLQGSQSMTSILEGAPVTEAKQWTLRSYCGPKKATDCAAVDRRLVATLDYGWLSPISSLLFSMLQWIYSYVGNYGVAIILLTILLKVLLLPFTARADKSQKRMMEIQKKMQSIERKYADDPERRELEKAELIRKHGISETLGLGCLPRILQVFVFIGLNRVLSVSIDLYRAPFVGWITNLAAIDPWYLLPILTGLGIFLQVRHVQGPRQLLTTAIMALIITGIMMNFAAGVVLFIAVSTWLDVLQTLMQERIRSLVPTL